MAFRPSWQGHLKLSLVTCPVSLYTATNAAGDVHFNLINPKTNNRIKMITTDPDAGPVERSSLIKGYEIEKGRYITVTDDEIKSVRLESTKTIDIERFVDISEIDRLYWNDPYYLVPDGKMAAEAYAVIREAMVQSGRIALGRVVLSTRERLMALEPNANFSTLIGMKLPTIIQGDFEPHFSLRNMLKDADFARELAAEAQLNAPALDCTAAAMRQGVEDGKGDLDFSVIGQR